MTELPNTGGEAADPDPDLDPDLDLDPEPEPKLPDGAYDAVVHFHGMGDQRRYAEVSQLIDALDLWAQPGRNSTHPSGRLHGITGRFDEGRGVDRPYVGHAELKHRAATTAGEPEPQGDAAHAKLRYRFYEAYWAPSTAKEIPARQVLSWLVSNSFRPSQVLRSSWRDHGRLRRSMLDGTKGVDLATRHALTAHHLAYENPTARRAHPKGSFAGFVSFLGGQGAEPSVIAAAKAWRRHVRRVAVVYQATMITFLVMLALVAAGTTALVFWGLEFVAGISTLADLLGDRVEASWGNAWTITGTVLLGTIAGGFLRRSLGDVLYWATLRETDERNAVRQGILQVATDTLRQVLEDDLCQRVVVTAHSLGTTIAYEALLELGRMNTASNRENPVAGTIPIDKLDQFITFGSPIDKIHFFFESERTTSHTLSTISEKLHLDIGSVPFAHNRRPHMHWINIWDPADVVSGPLESPRSTDPSVIRAVDNVQVAMLGFPEAGSAHLAYLGDVRVVEIIYDAIFHRRFSYRTPPKQAQFPKRPDYDAQVVPPVDSGGRVRTMQAVILLLPWLLGIHWLGRILSWPSAVVGITGWISVGIGAALIAGIALGRRHAHPLLLPPR